MSHTKKYLALLLFLPLILQACSQTPEVSSVPAVHSQWWASDFVPRTPCLDGVFGKAGSHEWQITGDYSLETDATAGDLLLAPEGKTIAIESQSANAGPRQVRVLVRFQPAGARSTLAFSLDESIRLELIADKAARTLTTQLESPVKRAPEAATLALRPFNQLAPIDPQDNPALAPSLADKWTQVRAELQKGLIRVWLDDKLILEQEDPSIDPARTLRVKLEPGAQLAQFVMTPIAQVPANAVSSIATLGATSTH
jgi:hypothetical protein